MEFHLWVAEIVKGCVVVSVGEDPKKVQVFTTSATQCPSGTACVRKTFPAQSCQSGPERPGGCALSQLPINPFLQPTFFISFPSQRFVFLLFQSRALPFLFWVGRVSVLVCYTDSYLTSLGRHWEPLSFLDNLRKHFPFLSKCRVRQASDSSLF